MVKRNIRQQELLENYKRFLRYAINEAERIQREGNRDKDIYDLEISIESFLNVFGLANGVGEYARKRYFKDFTRIRAFTTLNCIKGYFKINYDNAVRLANHYRIEIPKPKEEAEKEGEKS